MDSTEPKISSSLIFLSTAKLVWQQAQELYSGVNNLRHIYDLYQNYFSIALNDLSLEDYHGKFKNIREELNLYQPISSDIKVMQDNLGFPPRFVPP